MLTAFGVGLANFGTGRHVLPRELAAAVGERLPLIGWYGATGNFMLADNDPERVRAVLKEVSGTTCAVVPRVELNEALDILAALAEPPYGVDERPRPGLAFAVSRTHPGAVAPTARPDLLRVSAGVTAVRKLDVLKDGKLDRQQRRGGWGGVSCDIARQVGGQWTAPSRRTLDGLRLGANTDRVIDVGSLTMARTPGFGGSHSSPDEAHSLGHRLAAARRQQPNMDALMKAVADDDVVHPTRSGMTTAVAAGRHFGTQVLIREVSDVPDYGPASALVSCLFRVNLRPFSRTRGEHPGR